MSEHAGAAAREKAIDEPMGLLEAVILFGGLAVIFDGIGAVIGRLVGIDAPLLACLNIFLYIGAGFVAARYANIANGVWAGIAVVAIDAILGQLLVMAILPKYRELPTQLFASVPDGFLIVFVVAVAIGSLMSVMITGSICGVIGAAISHAGPFRPRYRYSAD